MSGDIEAVKAHAEALGIWYEGDRDLPEGGYVERWLGDDKVRICPPGLTHAYVVDVGAAEWPLWMADTWRASSDRWMLAAERLKVERDQLAQELRAATRVGEG